MNYNRIAYVLDEIADGYLKHGMPTHVPWPSRSPFICTCLEFARLDGVITDGDFGDTFDFLRGLGMVGTWAYEVAGFKGFYRTGSLNDEKQGIRWTWLKFAARLAREEAYAQRKLNGR